MNVIIVGGGVMGLSCAWRLAAAGARVTLFDARSCGHGATLAALGVLRPSSPFAIAPIHGLHHRSLWQFESFAREIEAAANSPITFRRMGDIEILYSQDALLRAERRATEAQKVFPKFSATHPTLEVLNHAQLQSEVPNITPSPYGALLCRATAWVNASQFVIALKTLCLRLGVIIRENCPVLALSSDGPRIVGITTASDTVTADATLITAGAWTPLPSAILKTAAPITPAKGQAIALKLPHFALTRIIKSRTTYLVPTPDEIFVGSTTEPEAGYGESPTASARDFLFNSAIAILPVLRNAPITRHWTGLRADTAGHKPLMGPLLSAPGLFICAGHYKTGLGMAPLASQLLAESILTNKIPPDLAAFLPERLRENSPPPRR